MLYATRGPVLEEAVVPEPEFELIEGWSCPVTFPTRKPGHSVTEAILEEIAELRPW